MDEFKKMEESFEIQALQKKISQQKAEIEKLRQVIKENDLEDEIENIVEISDAEFICIKGLEHFKKLYENGTFEKGDTQQVEILAKTLRMVRGQEVSSNKKSGKTTTNNLGELFKLASSEEK